MDKENDIDDDNDDDDVGMDLDEHRSVNYAHKIVLALPWKC